MACVYIYSNERIKVIVVYFFTHARFPSTALINLLLTASKTPSNSMNDSSGGGGGGGGGQMISSDRRSTISMQNLNSPLPPPASINIFNPLSKDKEETTEGSSEQEGEVKGGV
jgi:hypothetical protein